MMTGAPAFGSDRRERSVRGKTRGSLERFERARGLLAGGVSSSLRKSARPHPLYFDRGFGPRVTDVDGNTYLGYGLAWGPLILGHRPRPVVEAIQAQLERGLTFGAQHDLEFQVAELLTGTIPCADRVAFANSGTEIVQVALRLARAATGRQKHLKFEGHYHGWDDSVLVSYHPSFDELRESPSQPITVAHGQRPHTDVVVVEWNDQIGINRAFDEHGAEIAAVICEPLLANSGCIPPEPGFLELLRALTRQHGALLVFDEVITGFRLDLKGGQGFYGVTPDLATYAKAVAGGAALSVLAGRSEYMRLIETGHVVHAGTLNGNPLALAAARATIETLAANDGAAFTELWRLGERLRLGLERVLTAHGHAVVTQGGGPVFQLAFMDRPARTYRDTLAADRKLYSDFVLALDEGVLAIPDGRWYLSTAHQDADIDDTLTAAERAAA